MEIVAQQIEQRSAVIERKLMRLPVDVETHRPAPWIEALTLNAANGRLVAALTGGTGRLGVAGRMTVEGQLVA